MGIALAYGPSEGRAIARGLSATRDLGRGKREPMTRLRDCTRGWVGPQRQPLVPAPEECLYWAVQTEDPPTTTQGDGAHDPIRHGGPAPALHCNSGGDGRCP